MSKLRKIVVAAVFAGMVGLSGCASTGKTIVIQGPRGPCDSKDKLHLTCYDEDGNGLYEKLEIRNKGTGFTYGMQLLHPEMSFEEINSFLMKKGYDIVSSEKVRN
jgi:hypothetical protein